MKILNISISNKNKCNHYSVIAYLQSVCYTDKDQLIHIFTEYISGIKETIQLPDILPADLLSSRAINRRQKAGIPFLISGIFLSIKVILIRYHRLGFKLHATSKWMNTALFKSQSAFDIRKLT